MRPDFSLSNDAIVRGIGAESGQHLVDFDSDIGCMRRFLTAIVARSQIFVVGGNNLYAFKP